MAKKTGGKIFLWIIMGLLFFGLVGFGATGLTGNVRSVGTVAGQEISINRYARELSSQLRAFEAQAGSSISFVQAQQFGLDRLVLDQLILERVLDDQNNKFGLSVGDQNVRDQILTIAGFQDLSGNFSRETYRDALDRMGESEESFETSLRDEISRTILQAALLANVPTSETYRSLLIEFAGERRTVTWAELDAGSLDEPPAQPSGTDLQTFYDENPDQFMAPEAREITYAILTPDMLQSSLDVDAQSVAALYQERFDEFNQPEKRIVERLVFFDMEEANTAFERLTSDDLTFEELVMDRGLSLSDIDLGDITQGDLGAAGEVVFATDLQGITPPIETDLGSAIFRVNAIIDAQSQSLEEVAEQLESEIAMSRAVRLIDQEREAILDLLAGGAKLEDISERTPMEIGTLVWSEGSTDGPAKYDSFRTVAETTEPGDYPDIEDLSDGGIFLLRVDQVIAPKMKNFDEIQEEISEKWVVAELQSAIAKKASELVEQILPLSNFESFGLNANQEADLTRRSFVPGTPPEFVTEVFAAELGETFVINAGDSHIIVRVDGVAAPDLEDPDVQTLARTLADRQANSVAQDLFERTTSALRREADIRIDEAAVRAVHANFQ